MSRPPRAANGQPFGVYDIESNSWVKFEVLGFFDGKEFRTFDSPEKFLDAINREKYRGYTFYAHNGGRFDFLFLAQTLMERYEVRLIERGSSIIAAYVNTGRITYTIADSYALLPQSLKKLGEAFKVPHQKIEHDVTRGVSKKDRKLIRYLENDCRCLYEVIEHFSASQFVVTRKLTIASQALDTWRQKFLPTNDLQRVPIEHETIFRENFYSGGRVEIYKGKGSGVHVFDVNSLFPFAMCNPMPCGECREVTRFHPSKIGFYRVLIHGTPDWKISPLLEKRGGCNYYTSGRGYYYLSSAMLNYLRKVWGVRFSVDWGLVFDKSARLFDDYVHTLYKEKARAKGTGEYIIVKLLLNSLYGKMGAGRFREAIHTLDALPDANSTWYDEELGLALTIEESRSKFILPYLAGYITDLARLYHYRLMALSPDSVFYCDTDSILTTDYKTYSRFIGTELGALSYEGKFNAVFLAPKTYALKNEEKEIVKFKGFSAAKFTFSDMEKALKSGAPLEEKRERVLSIRECIKQEGMKKGDKTSRVTLKENEGRYLKTANTRKIIHPQYERRLLIPDRITLFDSMPIPYSQLPE